MFPTTAAVEVERPLNPTVAPESVIGHVTEMAFCLLLNVSNAVLERHPATPEDAVVHPIDPPEPTCVNDPVKGEEAESVDVAVPYTPEPPFEVSKLLEEGCEVVASPTNAMVLEVRTRGVVKVSGTSKTEPAPVV